MQQEDTPPPLPLKKRQKVLITISQDSSTIEHKDISLHSGSDSGIGDTQTKKVDNLDTLLAQLSDVNSLVVHQIDVSQTGNIQQVIRQAQRKRNNIVTHCR